MRVFRTLTVIALLGLAACASTDKMPVHETAFTFWSPQFADNSRLETRHASGGFRLGAILRCTGFRRGCVCHQFSTFVNMPRM